MSLEHFTVQLVPGLQSRLCQDLRGQAQQPVHFKLNLHVFSAPLCHRFSGYMGLSAKTQMHLMAIPLRQPANGQPLGRGAETSRHRTGEDGIVEWQAVVNALYAPEARPAARLGNRDSHPFILLGLA